jgi:4-alpha-glucanotransferase
MSERQSGILLHITSLPSEPGHGDFGPAAFRFVDWLAAAGQSLWQILPLNYPDGTGSPYTSFSANAINETFISPEFLCRDHFIDELQYTSIRCRKDLSATQIRRQVLALACDPDRNHDKEAEFQAFCENQKYWLHDTAIFVSIREQYPGSWYDFPQPLRDRDGKALKDWEQQYAAAIRDFKYRQFLLFRQWGALKSYANEKGIRLIGDIPIFISGDSADVWANRELFRLDEQGYPTVWTGVPPDLFTETGQLWAQPHYDWKTMRQHDYRWWVERVKLATTLADIIRIDHFRGFCAAWEVPYGAPTAENGQWVDGPREEIFRVLHREIPDLQIIAEDLGVITPDVDALRRKLGYPGMKVLQFAFNGDEHNTYLPKNFDPEDRFVVYTGTHDNDTTKGWYRKASPREKAMLKKYIPNNGDSVTWELIDMAYASSAMWAVIPMQDVLDLGSEARMNTPGTIKNNWNWQLTDPGLPETLTRRLKALTERHKRNVQ